MAFIRVDDQMEKLHLLPLKLPLLFVIAIIVVMSGCNVHNSGTYYNDPRAWKWAFGESSPPEGVAVVRSRYWSSAHWTAEYEWHFELQLDAKAVATITSDVGFAREWEPIDLKHELLEQPSWFLPNGVGGFDVYRSSDSPTYLIFIDPETRQSFWTAYTL